MTSSLFPPPEDTPSDHKWLVVNKVVAKKKKRERNTFSISKTENQNCVPACDNRYQLHLPLPRDCGHVEADLAHLWTKSASISYFQSTLLFLLDKTFPSSDIKVGPKSFVRGHILLSAAVLHVQYWPKSPGELYFQTAYNKTFQVMFTLTDTKLYKKKCTRGSRGTRLKRPKGPQKLRWDSHDKRPPAAVQTVLFYMVSKVLPQRRCTPCEVEPTKRGGKKEKETLITFSTTPSFSVWENIKAATLWHVALLFSASLSLSPDGAPEIMPQIEEDTQELCCLDFLPDKSASLRTGPPKGRDAWLWKGLLCVMLFLPISYLLI